ncbi:wiskott-Aldrich syndrome protein family member 2-like [Rhagoletis pomonella]|uniref:wiskott-Aldrich syndrome protein family member 2-like n=1 Tax=Rhagoletis pomonella TaxID=28610 RepID=UPI001783D130|nr:wiskott-Aldrich syndrome protein family member 2-like [Rhagoletis pomonella]XP_036325888.1 wiskott-Aldrich syndrome protein family member 2-like [Rhagoletis pomonella]XP_036341193.1 wiskott-Aldrich syndrome protein family member 2-like [Rhagoletis pomonella]
MQNNLNVRLAPKPRKRRLAWAEDGEVAILDLWEERVADLRGARKNGHIYAEMANELAKLGHNYSARDVQVKLANFTQRYRKEKLAMGPSGGSPSTWPLYARVHQIIGGFKANMFCELTLENISESDIASQPSPLTPILPSSLSPTFSSPLASPLPAVPTTPLPTPSPPLSSPLTPLPTTPLPTPSPPLSSPSSPMPSSSASAVEPKRRKVIGTLQKKVLDKFDGLSAEISQHIRRSEENEKEWMKIEKDKADTLREIANDNKELKVGILSFLNRN